MKVCPLFADMRHISIVILNSEAARNSQRSLRSRSRSCLRGTYWRHLVQLGGSLILLPSEGAPSFRMMAGAD